MNTNTLTEALFVIGNKQIKKKKKKSEGRGLAKYFRLLLYNAIQFKLMTKIVFDIEECSQNSV